MGKFLSKFIVLIVGLIILDVSVWGQKHIVEPFTAGLAKVCVAITKTLDSDVEASGKTIYKVFQADSEYAKANPVKDQDGNVIQGLPVPFGIEIAPGCNGLEAVAILIAMMLAFPATWKQRAIGLVAGFFAIQILNVVRIISLLYLGIWNKVWFDWFHLYLWQALIILDAFVVCLLWLRWISKQKREAKMRGAAAASTA
jgi:exosortase H (IPTLxxWG-CTERM-specific)